MSEESYVRVCYENNRELIPVKNTDTIAEFTAQCVKIFRINRDSGKATFRYTDQMRYRFTGENFIKKVLFYAKSDGFCLNLHLDGILSDIPMVITSPVSKSSNRLHNTVF